MACSGLLLVHTAFLTSFLHSCVCDLYLIILSILFISWIYILKSCLGKTTSFCFKYICLFSGQIWSLSLSFQYFFCEIILALT